MLIYAGKKPIVILNKSIHFFLLLSFMVLQRVTTRYVPVEDRISLVGEGSNGNTVSLWLTQRLASLLVSHLCNRLLERGGTVENAINNNLVLEFAQQAARSSMTNETPVVIGDQTLGVLVRDIDVSLVDSPRLRFRLLFKDEEQRLVGELLLELASLRQWLNVLYDQFRVANWPIDVWPDWIRDAASSAVSLNAVKGLH